MPVQSATIVAPAAYAASPNVALEWEPNTWHFWSDAGDFFISFDGANDHALMHNGDPTMIINTKRMKVWVKQSGGAATARVAALSIA